MDALGRSDDQKYPPIISQDRDSFSLQNASYHVFFGYRIIFYHFLLNATAHWAGGGGHFTNFAANESTEIIKLLNLVQFVV